MTTANSVRAATHAGSWYSSSPKRLDAELTRWLSDVDGQVIVPPSNVIDRLGRTDEAGGEAPSAKVEMPVAGCRAVIAPHAGYSYSGPAAAWAYKSIDTTGIKRVFILGPSHHVYLDGCALSACKTYATPIGDLPLDLDKIAELRQTGRFERDMSLGTDEDEHSIEMHLPYIRKVFEAKDIKVVPILVGAISTKKEFEFGELLAPHLADPENFFVVSSDFCHWGSRFSYQYYRTSATSAPSSLGGRLISTKPSQDYPIYQAITDLDGEGIAALTFPVELVSPPTLSKSASTSRTDKSASEAFEAFATYVRTTKNTVCGRHPIGVLFGALKALEEQGGGGNSGGSWECRFTRYEQSSQCVHPSDSSVSYASAYVKFVGGRGA